MQLLEIVACKCVETVGKSADKKVIIRIMPEELA